MRTQQNRRSIETKFDSFNLLFEREFEILSKRGRRKRKQTPEKKHNKKGGTTQKDDDIKSLESASATQFL